MLDDVAMLLAYCIHAYARQGERIISSKINTFFKLCIKKPPV